MTFSYFPGCTLKTKAKDLDRYARASAEALGFTLEELPDWQCCGGVYPMVGCGGVEVKFLTAFGADGKK